MTKSIEAQQILDNRMFQEGFAALESDAIKALRTVELNGSPESIAMVMEITRQLQAATNLKRKFESAITGARFTEHNDNAKRLRDS